MKKTPRSVFLKLVEIGYVRGYMIGSPDSRAYERAIQNGTEIPDRCLPGRCLSNLSEKERRVLAGLTADMTQDRIDYA